MALLNQPVQNNKQIQAFFDALRSGTAPERVNRQFLKDIGFKSSNHLQFIPLLKGLGFLTSDGSPTDRYRQFLDKSRWTKVLAEAVREAYGDIFVIKAKPTKGDIPAISGKFKSTFNQSDLQAERSARTFIELLELSDKESLYSTNEARISLEQKPDQNSFAPVSSVSVNTSQLPSGGGVPPNIARLGLHYNIQIHLPATKDVEVYNAIFKSLRDHLID